METNHNTVDSNNMDSNQQQGNKGQHQATPPTPPPQPQQYDLGHPTGGEESAPIISVGLNHWDPSSNLNLQHTRLSTDSYKLMEVQARPPLSTALTHHKPANQVRHVGTNTQINNTTTMIQPSREDLEPSTEQADDRIKSSQPEPVPRNPQVKWWLELAKRRETKGVEETSPTNTDKSIHPLETRVKYTPLIQEYGTNTVPVQNLDIHSVKTHETEILTKNTANASQITQSQLTNAEIKIDHHQGTPSNKHRNIFVNKLDKELQEYMNCRGKREKEGPQAQGWSTPTAKDRSSKLNIELQEYIDSRHKQEINDPRDIRFSTPFAEDQSPIRFPTHKPKNLARRNSILHSKLSITCLTRLWQSSCRI